MTQLVFFEKPGCGGNARQRAALEAAGHTLERRNLLTAHWTPDSLLAFLAPLPVPVETAAVEAWVGLGTNPASARTLEGCASPTESCASPD